MTRRRAYLYLTREQEGRLEVAVFRYPDKTVTLPFQVPGGTIEPHETPDAGALREAFEESGLADFNVVRSLAADRWRFPDGNGERERYFYQLSVAGPTPNTWNHIVSDGELDQGMVFTYHWLTPDDARLVLRQMGDYLHLLR